MKSPTRTNTDVLPAQADEVLELLPLYWEALESFDEYETDEAESEYHLALADGLVEPRPWRPLRQLRRLRRRPSNLTATEIALLDALADLAVQQMLAEQDMDVASSTGERDGN